MYSIMFNEALPSPPPLPAPVREEVEGLKFPVYLLPSLSMPFRRRRQSSQSSHGSPPADTPPSLSSSPTDSTPSSPTRRLSIPSFTLPTNLFTNSRSKGNQSALAPLERSIARTQPNTIRCSTCASDFAFASQIVSKGFTGRYGRAFLVSAQDQPLRRGIKAGDLINIKIGKSETRLLVTGSHVVADIFCTVCHAKVGWKYIDAKEESQKYKIGKYILETQRVVVYRNWEDTRVGDVHEFETEQENVPTEGDAEPVIFDSDDEDECEDIFMGTWDANVVAKRRSRKVNRRPKNNDD
ncbi:yippee-domain-containing protein [Daldinia vernicosa]|uniref:yippee-domain-containing protein n=1 Tax=Daldinia vernicosa TaxID=114800 RepID=UPI0020075A7B|nr:yippee-domain-containing protein [Daldinia vernicosa]KAI0844708.1 yippee-domain-containing protein [Daldinia vernicosa]